METELNGLYLTPAEWLEILLLRTSDAALDIVRRAKNMGVTDPQTGLEFIWKQLNDRFKKKSSGAKEVLKELQNFPEVRPNDPEGLWKFSVICEQAKTLAATDQGRALAVLDFADVQKTVTGRLNETLKCRWRTKYAKLATDSPDELVPFYLFCDWISKIANESSLDGVQYEDTAQQKGKNSKQNQEAVPT